VKHILGAWDFLSDLLDLTGDRHIGLIAAGVAFFLMLALFPAAAAVVAVWGFFADPAIVSEHLSAAADFLPHEAYAIVENQIGALISANVSQFGWATAISIGAALWSTRTGVGALVQGVNATFGAENRTGIGHQVVALLLTLALIGMAIVAMAATIVLPLVLAFAPLGPLGETLVTLVRWSIAPVVTVFGIGLFYRYGPNQRGARRPRWFTPGLLVAVVLWLAGSEAFSVYLANFGNYNRIYGSIGALVALLMWFYLSAYAILLGAAVNAVIEDRRAVP